MSVQIDVVSIYSLFRQGLVALQYLLNVDIFLCSRLDLDIYYCAYAQGNSTFSVFATFCFKECGHNALLKLELNYLFSSL